jgi:hypothetical protein
MNSKKKGLIIGGIVLIVLIGIMLALLLTQNKEEGTDTSDVSSEETTYSLIAEDGVLTSLDVVNETGSYTINNIGEQKWAIDQLDGYTTSDDEFSDTIDRYTTLDAKDKILDEVTDLSKYGLDTPAATGVVTFDNGNSYQVSVGNMTPDDAGYYAMLEGDPALYTITVANGDILKQSMCAYLDLALIPANDTEDPATVESMRFSRKDLDHEFYMEAIEKDEESNIDSYTSVFQLVSPVVCDLDASVVDTEMLTPLFGLTASEAVAINASDVLADYGLDDPFAVVELKYDGRTATLTFGDPVDDSKSEYYATYNDNNVIYKISTDSVAALTVNPDDMVSSLTILPYIDDVSEVKIDIGGKVYQYALSGTEDELKVEMDGQTIDTDNFKALYQLILTPGLEAINYDEPTGEPSVTITFSYRDGSTPNVVEYYDTGRKMIYSIDGVATRSGRSAYLTKLETEIGHLIAGEDVEEYW